MRCSPNGEHRFLNFVHFFWRNKMSKDIHHKIYDLILKLGIDLNNENLLDSYKSTSKGFMDLNFDLLYHNKNKGVTEFALSHYYKQGGDLLADPDMIIRAFHNGSAEAMTFQQDAPPTFQKVYDGD